MANEKNQGHGDHDEFFVVHHAIICSKASSFIISRATKKILHTIPGYEKFFQLLTFGLIELWRSSF